jgi:hypothetical protein
VRFLSVGIECGHHSFFGEESDPFNRVPHSSWDVEGWMSIPAAPVIPTTSRFTGFTAETPPPSPPLSPFSLGRCASMPDARYFDFDHALRASPLSGKVLARSRSSEPIFSAMTASKRRLSSTRAQEGDSKESAVIFSVTEKQVGPSQHVQGILESEERAPTGLSKTPISPIVNLASFTEPHSLAGKQRVASCPELKALYQPPSASTPRRDGGGSRRSGKSSLTRPLIRLSHSTSMLLKTPPSSPSRRQGSYRRRPSFFFRRTDPVSTNYDGDGSETEESFHCIGEDRGWSALQKEWGTTTPKATTARTRSSSSVGNNNPGLDIVYNPALPVRIDPSVLIPAAGAGSTVLSAKAVVDDDTTPVQRVSKHKPRPLRLGKRADVFSASYGDSDQKDKSAGLEGLLPSPVIREGTARSCYSSTASTEVTRSTGRWNSPSFWLPDSPRSPGTTIGSNDLSDNGFRSPCGSSTSLFGQPWATINGGERDLFLPELLSRRSSLVDTNRGFRSASSSPSTPMSAFHLSSATCNLSMPPTPPSPAWFYRGGGRGRGCHKMTPTYRMSPAPPPPSAPLPPTPPDSPSSRSGKHGLRPLRLLDNAVSERACFHRLSFFCHFPSILTWRRFRLFGLLLGFLGAAYTANAVRSETADASNSGILSLRVPSLSASEPTGLVRESESEKVPLDQGTANRVNVNNKAPRCSVNPDNPRLSVIVFFLSSLTIPL